MEIDSLLEPFSRFGVNLGLSRIIKLLEDLGNPQDSIPIIHVAGTNGKGSVCAYISSVLIEAGYKVGRYTSPHLVDWTERICINGQPITSESLVQVISEVIVTHSSKNSPSEKLERQTENEIYLHEETPTKFEIFTAASWLYFAQQKIDVAVIEVGLGGRLDATNVCSQPLVSVITSISKDHLQVLGSTVAEIATEKAGILKKNCPVVMGKLTEEAGTVMRSRAEELGCPILLSPSVRELSPGVAECDGISYKIPLRGQVQLENSSIAIAALKVLKTKGWDISDTCISNGIGKTQWLGRIQWASWNSTRLLVDGSHNADSALALRNYIDSLPGSSTSWIIGMLDNKQHQEVLSILLRPEDKLYLVPVPDHSYASPEKLKEIALGVCPSLSLCQTFPDVFLALNAAASRKNDSNDLVALCGSLYLVGKFLAFTKS